MKKEMHKSIFSNKGFVQLLWKLGVFGLIILIEGIFIQNRVTIPADWWASIYIMSTEFAMAGIFISAGIFFLIARKELLNIKPYPKFNFFHFLPLFIVNLIFASLFVQLMRNMVAETQTSLSLVFLWYMTSALMVGSLFFSIFPYKSVIEFFSTQKTFISAMIGGSFALYYQVFKGFWHVFALIVAKAVFFMLKIFYPDVTFSMNRDLTPIIGTKAFNVLIAGPCSGIDGVKLFLILFTFFLVLDWKVINPKRALFLYFAGTLLMFTVNIFRVFSVLVMGNVVNPEFAMASFHTNIGWVLFTAVFIIFEYFTYNWMRER